LLLKNTKKLNPAIKEGSRYIGVKTEITFKKQPRGYLYHIVNPSQGIWALVPGKFTLSFSMAPEFYRQVYKKNPRKHFKSVNAKINQNNLVSNTVWVDTFNALGT